MNKQNEERDIYFIPPNFLTEGRILGGSIRIRNAVEAALLVLAVSLPLVRLPVSVTVKAVLLCLLPLPLGILGIAGIDGDSLTEFAVNWCRWYFRRRVALRSGIAEDPQNAAPLRKKARHSPPPELGIRIKASRGAKEHLSEEIVPIRDIRNGIIETEDGRYVRILEIEPINFLLRSASEQRSIISCFASWMKISPVKVQFKVLSKKADISKHLSAIERDMERETDPKCRELQRDYEQLIRTIGSREAVTRRFLLIFEYEPVLSGRRAGYAEIVSTLETAAGTAAQYFLRCGNAVVRHEDEDAFLLELFYSFYNRRTCETVPLRQRIRDIRSAGTLLGSGRAPGIAQVLAPDSVSFEHGSYTVMDGVYHAYLEVPGSGFNSRVAAGWTSLLVNAGEGIDVDLYLQRQPKENILTKLGQQIRINRSRIMDTSDTGSDFDEVEGAIRSGYYLRQGLSDFEDFYYVNLLITVTAGSLEDLRWRTAEVQRMLLSQNTDARVCHFRQEDALRTVLPLCSMDRRLYEYGKRNMLTSAAASCYPFTSYEMSDENGILLGVNRHNNSLVIVDIFNSRTYKNANIAILGTSGAGKTFTLQLMALRMRRKGTQVFIIAPLKGHEFLRACRNIGGEFISVSPGSKQCINIMEIRRTDQRSNAIIDGGVSENSILSGKIQQLHIFFSLLIPDMDHEEKQLLDEALIRTYAAKGITHDNRSLPDPQDPSVYREMPLLEDVYNVLMEAPETKRLGNILNRLVHGSAKSFNQQTNVDLCNPYTVLDISELTGDLLTVGMFVALDFVWDKAREDRTKEKAIFIDEIWELLGAGSNAMAAEFCLEIFKIIRGYGGSAVCATQDISDFFALEGGRFGKGIINNAKTKIVLNLEEDEASRVQEILKLTDTEVSSITGFERGCGLISTNSNHITVEFRASPLEKKLITTDRYELRAIVEGRDEVPD